MQRYCTKYTPLLIVSRDVEKLEILYRVHTAISHSSCDVTVSGEGGPQQIQ